MDCSPAWDQNVLWKAKTKGACHFKCQLPWLKLFSCLLACRQEISFQIYAISSKTSAGVKRSLLFRVLRAVFVFLVIFWQQTTQNIKCFQHFLFILLWLILQCCSNCFIDNLLNSWWHIDFILFFPWANAQHSILDKLCMVLSLGETVRPLCAHKSLRRACLKNSVFFISHQAKGEWLWEHALGFAVYPTVFWHLWVGYKMLN